MNFQRSTLLLLLATCSFGLSERQNDARLNYASKYNLNKDTITAKFPGSSDNLALDFCDGWQSLSGGYDLKRTNEDKCAWQGTSTFCFDTNRYIVDVRVNNNGDGLQCRFSRQTLHSFKYSAGCLELASSSTDQWPHRPQFAEWLDMTTQNDGSWKTAKAYCAAGLRSSSGYYQIEFSETEQKIKQDAKYAKYAVSPERTAELTHEVAVIKGATVNGDCTVLKKENAETDLLLEIALSARLRYNEAHWVTRTGALRPSSRKVDGLDVNPQQAEAFIDQSYAEVCRQVKKYGYYSDSHIGQ